MNELLQIDNLAFNICRSRQRKTLELIVGRSGDLTLRAPDTATIDELERWAKRRLLWVHRKLALKESASPKVRRPDYVSGEAFAYLGRRYPLKIVPIQDSALRFENGRFLLRQTDNSPEQDFREWYIQTGSPWLAVRTNLLSK